MSEAQAAWMQTLWAKTDKEDKTRFHLLIYHLIDVAEVAQLLWRTVLGEQTRTIMSRALGLPEDQAERFVAFVVGLHDLGKASPAFQRKYAPAISSLTEQGLPFGFGLTDIPHGVATTVALAYKGRGLLIDAGLTGKPVAVALARVIGGHHGVWPDVSQMKDAYNAAYQSEWDVARETLFNALREIYNPPDLPEGMSISTESFNAFLMLLSGLTTIADWIGSMSEYFPLRQNWMPLETYRKMACVQAEQVLQETGWLRESLPIQPLSFANLLPQSKDEPNQVQRAVLAYTTDLTDQSLVLLEAPTGIGKTEIAFYLSSRLLGEAALLGLYVAMPTQATSNQMHGRVSRFLETLYAGQALPPRLLHSQAMWQLDEKLPTPSSVFDDETASRAGAAARWFRSNKKRGLLEPFAVGTVDQALLSVLWTRHFFVRLFGLRDKVLIFDEIHAYDTYMSELFMVLLEWMHWLGSSIIILSATLPNAIRRRLVEQFGGSGTALDATDPCNARLTMVSTDGRSFAVSLEEATQQRQIQVEWIGAETLIATLEDATREGGCVAVICNTVRHAQEQYRKLKEAQVSGDLADCELFLFHARYPAAWRQDIEIIATQRFGVAGPRPRRAILVATQVIEQSLDLDFDLLITELPPIDLLIQRIGRLHRHAREGRPAPMSEPRVLILKPGMQDNLPMFGDSEFIYDRFLLLASWAALQHRETLYLPDQSRELIETVYGEGWRSLPWCDALAEAQPSYTSKQDDSEYHASLKYIPPPDAARLLDGRNIGLDEEDPTLHQAFQALTREIEPTVQVICLHRVEGDYSLEPDGSEPVNLFGKPNLRRLLRYTVGISSKYVFSAICERSEYDLPAAWAEEAALKHHRMAVFENDRCRVAGTRWFLRLSRDYGLEIEKEDKL